jgi:hypothetical protein
MVSHAHHEATPQDLQALRGNLVSDPWNTVSPHAPAMADLDRALHMSTEGITASAIARVVRASASTVTRWARTAGPVVA